VIGSLKNFGEKFQAWDRDFGWTYRTALFVLALVSLVVAPFWVLARGKSRPSAQSITASSPLAVSLANGAEAALTFEDQSSSADQESANQRGAPRVLYPFSVIPGGAYSKQELERAITNDPIVAHHYDDFDVARTSVVLLSKPELMYVSYRVGSKVYWTSKPLLLREGEAVLTDGKNIARTRCGNRLSLTPATPVSKEEPENSAMDAAPDVSLYSLNLPSSSPVFAPAFPLVPTAPPSGAEVPAAANEILPPLLPVPYFPVVGGSAPGLAGGLPPTGPGAPVATPEPSSAALLAIGVTLLLFLSWRIGARLANHN
jgi:hypothetical protein